MYLLIERFIAPFSYTFILKIFSTSQDIESFLFILALFKERFSQLFLIIFERQPHNCFFFFQTQTKNLGEHICANYYLIYSLMDIVLKGQRFHSLLFLFSAFNFL